MKVYLIGPINGCTDAECNDWRDLVTRLLPKCEMLNPMRRDYRGRELDPAITYELVNGDLKDCDDCDVAIAFRPKPSDGSAMEQFYLYKVLDKPVITIIPKGTKPSPWTVYF
ncbi:MAG TPA: hypothetical protein VJQ25_00955, partial [Nitrospira sp.]|nr:hypothetical protein [Nitrospira sp.]